MWLLYVVAHISVYLTTTTNWFQYAIANNQMVMRMLFVMAHQPPTMTTATPVNNV